MGEPISIPNAEFLDTLPLERGNFYGLLVAAVAEKASELRFEPGGVIGNLWCKVEGTDYELVPIPREEAEQEIVALVKRNYTPLIRFFRWLTKRCDSELRFDLVIGGEITEVLAIIQPGQLILKFHFPDSSRAPEKACEILKTKE